MLRALLLLCGLLLFQADASAQKKKRETFTDPVKAGPDFAIQGEYVGNLPGPDGQDQKWGAQVIAQGDHRFEVMAYRGGLPGDGWDRSDPIKAAGKTENGVTKLKSDMGYAIVNKGSLTIYHDENQKLGELKKVERKSPTLGMKPPKGAVVLFDGKTNDFNPGKTTKDGLLMVGQNSKRIFDKDFTLHLEFRTPFRSWATGQKRGNSGVYLQRRYEVQILDSFGLKGKRNECGGLYGRKDCDLNMCYPPLSWQTYDIEFKVAKIEKGKVVQPAMVTVKHNGVVIHDKVKLGRSPAKGGPLHLQNHGNPVHFRNIWAVIR